MGRRLIACIFQGIAREYGGGKLGGPQTTKMSIRKRGGFFAGKKRSTKAYFWVRDIFPWGGGLLRQGAEVKKFGMLLETQRPLEGRELFGRQKGEVTLQTSL